METVCIRILHVIGVMDRGGAETMIMNLYRRIDRERIQFDFVVHTDKEGAYDGEITALGGRIFHCPRYRICNHLAYRAWWDRFFEDHGGEFRIVHGHIGSTAAIYLSAAKKRGLFVIAHSHNTYGSLTPKDAFYRMLSYPTRFRADFFLACSKQAGMDRYGKKTASNPGIFRVFPNGIDTKQFAYDPLLRERTRQALQLSENAPVIGHVGRFFRVKNHSFILEVFSALLKEMPDARLVLVGDGPLKEEMERKAADLGIGKAVLFTGVREDIAALMQAMDVMLFPSLYEGLPLTLVEAQTAGLPIVMSDRVPAETILTEGLVKAESLKSPVELWVRELTDALGVKRKSRQERITEKGFDIGTTARWLEEFYIERS